MEAVLIGEPVRATDEQMGLINRVVPAGAQLEEAKRLAQLIAARPPLLFASEDKREGMRAFLEKRPGRFTGR